MQPAEKRDANHLCPANEHQCCARNRILVFHTHNYPVFNGGVIVPAYCDGG